jgi:hypothetical protein
VDNDQDDDNRSATIKGPNIGSRKQLAEINEATKQMRPIKIVSDTRRTTPTATTTR